MGGHLQKYLFILCAAKLQKYLTYTDTVMKCYRNVGQHVYCDINVGASMSNVPQVSDIGPSWPSCS